MGDTLSYEAGASLGLPSPKKVVPYADAAALGLPSSKPTESSSTLGAAADFAKSLVVPSRQDYDDPKLQAFSYLLSAMGAADVGVRPSSLGPPALLPGQEGEFRRANKGLSPGEVATGVKDADVERAFTEERERNPKTQLAAGVLAPFPTKVKEQMLVSGALGALHGYRTAPEGEKLSAALKNAAASAALAGVTGKLIHKGVEMFRGSREVALSKQMAATLGPEGFVHDPYVASKDVSGGPRPLSERGTVADYRVGEGTAVGPRRQVSVGPEGTRTDRPGVRGEEVTNVRADREATGAFEPPAGEGTVADRPYYQPGRGKPPRNEAPLGSAAGPDQPRVSREPGAPRTNEPVSAGPLRPSERRGDLSPRDLENRAAADALYGDHDARVRAVSEARSEYYRTIGKPEPVGEQPVNGKWPSGRKTFEDEVFKMSDMELKAASRKPQIAQMHEAIAAELKAREAKGAGDVSMRAPKVTPQPVEGRAEFQSAMDFLTGEDELGKTVTRYIHPDELALGSREKAMLVDPDATFVKSSRLGKPVGGGSGKPGMDPGAWSPGEQAGTPRPFNHEAQPLPAPPVSGPLTPDDIPTSGLVHAEEVLRLSKRDKGSDFAKLFSLPEFRATEEVAYAIRAVKAAKAARAVELKNAETLKASLRPGEYEKARRIIVGQRDRHLLADAVSELPAGFRQQAVHAQQRIQNMTLNLARGGYYSPQELKSVLATLKDAKAYWHRSHEAFTAKKGFEPTLEAIDEAARFVSGDKGVSMDEARGLIREQLSKFNREGSSLKSPRDLAVSFRDAGLMKSRTLPPQLHKLFGVINDPAYIIADTLGELSQQHAIMNATKAMVAPQFKGKVWSDVQLPEFAPERLWDPSRDLTGNKRLFGELAGKYVPHELFESMVDATTPAARSALGQLWDVPKSIFAMGKILTSPITWTRNLLSNGYNLMLAGVPPHRWARLAKLASKSMLDAGYFANLSPSQRLNSKLAGKLTLNERAASSEFARMAREDWALPEGRGTDWGGDEARRIVEEMVRAAPEGWPGIHKRLISKFQGAKGTLGRAYELADQLPRLMAYIHHLESGVKLGMPETAARARASHLVNQWFASGANAGPIFRQLAQSGGSPFAGWFADNLRVHKNIATAAFKGDFAPLLRASLYYGGMYGGLHMLQQYYGFTDSDIAEGQKALKPSWGDNHALIDWVPFRGKNGEMYAVSMDGLMPFAAFLKHPDGSIAKGIAQSVVQGLTGAGPLEMPANAALEAAGIAKARYNPPPLPSEEGFALFDKMYRWAEPTLVRQARDVARKAQLTPAMSPLRDAEEPQGFGEAMATTFNPLAIEKVGLRTQEGKRRQEQGAIGALKGARRQEIKKGNDPGEANRRMLEKRRQQAR